MLKAKGFTQKDQSFIQSRCRSIAKLDEFGVEDNQLRQQLYMLGVYAYRQFHKAGLPQDMWSPRLN